MKIPSCHHSVRALAVRFPLMMITLSAAAQEAVPPLAWRAAAPMATARYDHCSVRLPDGRIFVIGGTGPGGPLNSTEIYGPDDQFQPGPSLTSARTRHTCTVLSDGRILAAGGGTGASADLFDPVTFQWSSVSGGVAGRNRQTAALLPGDRVLLAGGRIGDEISGILEIYDPNTNTIALSASALQQARERHSATTLPDGRVLIAGGATANTALNSSEIYDPLSDSVSTGPAMTQVRAGHAAVELADGRILFAGGGDGNMDLASTEVYLPGDGGFVALAASLQFARQDAFTIRLQGGQVLIAGGLSGGLPIGETELFDAVNNQFLSVGPLTAARSRITGALLDDGSVLATGGLGADGPSAACGLTQGPLPALQIGQSLLQLTEIASFSPGPVSELNIGSPVLVFGQNFRNNQGINLTVQAPDSTVLATASATPDSTGSFFSSANYTVQAADVGKRFTVIAQQGNTIPNGAQVQYDAKAPLSGSFSVPASSVTGVTIPITVLLATTQPSGFLTGTFTFKIGAVTQTFLADHRVPGTAITFNFCCVNDPGTYSVNFRYSGDPNYRSLLSLKAPLHNVVAKAVTIRNDFSTPLPLFTSITMPFEVIAPAVLAPTPGGTLTLSRLGTSTTQTLAPPILTTSSTPSSTASFAYRSTFADRPTACFSVSYSGDGFYPPANTTSCLPTGPAPVTLRMFSTASTYNFGTRLPVNILLTFPQELGVVTRSVVVQPLGLPVSLNVGIGQASALVQLLLPFNTTFLTATYAGGGDLQGATTTLSVTMNPLNTSLAIEPFTSAVTNPFSLKANIKANLPSGVNLNVPISGTVQFFDGTLFIGQASLVSTSGSAGEAQATLTNVIRPTGVRSITAVYLGTPLFVTSQSSAIQVTVH